MSYDATAQALADEIVAAKAHLLDAARYWSAERAFALKGRVAAEHGLSDGAVTIALSRLVDSGELVVVDGDGVYKPLPFPPGVDSP